VGVKVSRAIIADRIRGDPSGGITSHYEGPHVKRFISLTRLFFPAIGGEVYEAGV
jgi:hypothetical protein